MEAKDALQLQRLESVAPHLVGQTVSYLSGHLSMSAPKSVVVVNKGEPEPWCNLRQDQDQNAGL